MRFESYGNFIELKSSIKYGGFGLDSPAFSAYVEIFSRGFSAKPPEKVFIFRSTFEAFVTDLDKLNRERKGEAKLYDVETFDLKISSIDRLGHMLVQGNIGYSVGEAANKLEFAFELDPSTLSLIVKDAKELLRGI
jgi:hypothetical protein